MRRTLALTLFASSLLVAASAHAGPEADVRIAWGSASKESPTFFELPPGVIDRTDPSVNDAIWRYRTSAEPYGGGLIAQLSFGFRFIPFLSAGFSGGYRKSSATAPDDTYKDLERVALEVGPYLRGYIPLVPFLDPWVSLGVEYMNDTQKYSRSGIDHTITHHGVAMPATIGIDYVAIPLLKIGPSFQYTTVFPAGGCYKSAVSGSGATSQCTDSNPQLTHIKGYGVWSIGLSVRVGI